MKPRTKKEKNSMVKLTFEIPEKDFQDAVQKAYLKMRNSITIPGFRKGKAPKALIEAQYGKGVFYEEAINIACPDAYEAAVKATGIEPVDRPQIDIETFEEGKPVVLAARVTVKPEVKLGEYKSIKVEKVAYTVSDDDVDNMIKAEQEKNSRMVAVEDRAVQDGDIANIDFEGFVDGVAFEGGKGEGFDLTIGSGQFIPGFEEQVIGVNIGDEKDIEVTFPEEYHEESLKGKAAVFKIKVNSIQVKELPELDDEFAKDVSEFDTLDAYKADVRSKLEEQAKQRGKNETDSKILDTAVENAKVDIPDVMIEQQMDRAVRDFEMRLSQQGLGMDMYLQYLGMKLEDLREQYREDATKQVKNTLVIEAIAKAENITTDDSDVDEEIKKMADSYKMEEEKVREIMASQLDALKEDIAFRKTMNFIIDAADVQ